jgi:hypothetical protein
MALDPETQRRLGNALRTVGGAPAQESFDIQNGLQGQIEQGPKQVTGLGNQTWEDAVTGYRDAGAAMQGRTAPVLDQRQADQSRGLQLNALDMLRRQGSGEAPSSAEILSQRANQNAVRNAGAQVTGARTAGGGIAALRGAGNAAGNAMLAGNAQNADARAGEISRGQGAFASGAGTAQGQDIHAATTNAQLEAQQRSLNEAGQQGYEAMGWNTRNAELRAGLDAQKGHDTNVAALRDIHARISAGNTEQLKGAVNFGTSVGGGLMTGGASVAAEAARRKAAAGSDERMKTHIGSLSALMNGRR